jgi:hypothetical protein
MIYLFLLSSAAIIITGFFFTVFERCVAHYQNKRRQVLRRKLDKIIVLETQVDNKSITSLAKSKLRLNASKVSHLVQKENSLFSIAIFLN